MIIHHSNLVYHDGPTGIKYLILLNTPDQKDPYLFVKATSQKKNNPSDPGCLKNNSLYFIPSQKTFFPLDTWIQLSEIYPIDRKDIDTDKNISVKGQLNIKLIDDVVNCLFETEEENVAPIFQRLLRPPLCDLLLKLKAKFES